MDLPSFAELPAVIPIIPEVGTLMIDNLNKTIQKDREHETFIYMENGEIRARTIEVQRSSVPPQWMWLQALSQNTVSIYQHSHPSFYRQNIPGDSLPSSADTEHFKKLNRAAYIFAITQQFDSTLIVQTKESFNYNLGNIFSTTLGALLFAERQEILYGQLAKEVAKLQSIEDWRGVPGTEFRPELMEKATAKYPHLFAQGK